MKLETMKRIVDRANMNRETVIGRFTYRLDDAGFIQRVKTEDRDRAWILPNGHVIDAWDTIARVVDGRFYAPSNGKIKEVLI